MVDNFFFRNSVTAAALWDMYHKIKGKPEKKQERLVTIYDNGKRFKAIIK